MRESLQRAELLFGCDQMQRIRQLWVIIFGVGGVGSWCAEALVRSGVGSLTMVDADVVDVTNINRQLPATTLTVGRPKAQVLAERLSTINPDCQIVAKQVFYDAANASEFHLEQYDVVIDAIDSVTSKMALIRHATSLESTKFLSSMGAARRLDPTRVQLAEFWKVKGCPLARALRDRFKRECDLPRRKFLCAYSDEAVTGEPKGSYMPVTAAFGMALAAEALKA